MPKLASACMRARRRLAAWAAHPPAGAGVRGGNAPTSDVDGAYRALRATVARGLEYRTGSSDLAEDLTQDVFVDLLLASRCRPPSNTRAWLARVAQRHVADTIGSAVRERTARAQLEDSRRGLPDEVSADPEIRLAIRACMARLSPRSSGSSALRLLQGQSVRALRPPPRHERGRRPHALRAGAACVASRARTRGSGGSMTSDAIERMARSEDWSERARAARLIARAEPGDKEEIVLRLLRDPGSAAVSEAMVAALLEARREGGDPAHPALARP